MANRGAVSRVTILRLPPIAGAQLAAWQALLDLAPKLGDNQIVARSTSASLLSLAESSTNPSS